MSGFENLAAIFKARTPGPWATSVACGDVARYDNPDGSHNLNSSGAWAQGPRQRSSLKAENDARFIAAAGTLADEILAVLEAAEYTRERIDFPEEHPLSRAISALRAAVSKLSEGT